MNRHLIMILSIIVLTVIILGVTTLLVVSYMPKKTYVDDNNILVLQYIIGKPEYISLDEVQMIEQPEGLLSSLIRTNGLSMGKYHTGKFKNPDTDQKVYLFLTGKKTRCFLYNGYIYLVDDWMSSE